MNRRDATDGLWHLHPELVEVEADDTHVWLCRHCNRAVHECRVHAPRLSIAAGVDYGAPQRLGLDEPSELIFAHLIQLHTSSRTHQEVWSFEELYLRAASDARVLAAGRHAVACALEELEASNQVMFREGAVHLITSCSDCVGE